MSENDWKQSAVIFYAFGTILTLISFVGCCLYSLYKNKDRKRSFQKILCFCCYRDPMQQYDTIQRTDDDVEMGSEFIPKQTDNVFTITSDGDDDDEIDVDIHGDNEHKDDDIFDENVHKNGIFDDSAI